MKAVREIANLAKKMPMIYDYIVTEVEITGEDIHLSGLDSTGIENSDKIYLFKMPFYYPVNHKRRMIKAYKKEGFEGVKKYIENL